MAEHTTQDLPATGFIKAIALSSPYDLNEQLDSDFEKRALQLVANPASACATVFNIAQHRNNFHPSAVSGTNSDNTFNVSSYQQYIHDLTTGIYFLTDPPSATQSINIQGNHYNQAFQDFINMIGGDNAFSDDDKKNIVTSVQNLLVEALNNVNKDQEKECLIVLHILQFTPSNNDAPVNLIVCSCPIKIVPANDQGCRIPQTEFVVTWDRYGFHQKTFDVIAWEIGPCEQCTNADNWLKGMCSPPPIEPLVHKLY